jgi:hypothetical protein
MGTGLAGTILGVRAELRASWYDPRWTLEDGQPARLHNRTGEDAIRVRPVVSGGRLVSGPTDFALIPDGASGGIYVRPDDDRPSFHVAVFWTRPRNGKRYVYPRRHPFPGGALAKREPIGSCGLGSQVRSGVRASG